MLKLETGVFKYPEICKMMGWEKKTGNTKISQLKELESYCKFNKEGTRFNIEEVYSNEIIFKPESTARKGKYNVEVGSSILAVVTSTLRKEQGVVYMRTQELIIETTLANEKLFSSYMADGFSKLEITSYKDIAKKMTYKALESGLGWLNSSRTLKNEKVRIVGFKDGEDFIITREVTTEEDDAIFEGEQKVLSDWGYENIFNVMVRNELVKFGNEVLEYIYENYGFEFEYYYLATKFTVTKFSKDRGLQLATKKADLNKEVWEKTHKALVENAIKRKTRMEVESQRVLDCYKSDMIEGFGQDKKFVNVIYGYPDYIENFESLDKTYRG